MTENETKKKEALYYISLSFALLAERHTEKKIGFESMT